MKIESVFEDGGKIPEKYTFDGDNVNPPLKLYDVPENAKSLVLVIEDPDAPGKIWTHWILWNIPSNTKKIEEDDVPDNSKQGLNDFGRVGYDGPNPPSGTHHYLFKIYALDTSLSLDESSRKRDVLDAMQSHIIDQATLKCVYSKK